MLKISLKRIISKNEVKVQIKGIVELDASSIVINDPNGKNLYTSENYEANKNTDMGKITKHQVLLENSVIGWVVGSAKAKVIADLLTYICNTEFEKKTIGKETLEKYKELNVLYEITEKLAVKISPKKVAELVVAEVKQLITADSVSVMFYNEENEIFELIANSENLNDGKGLEAFKLGEGIAGNVGQVGKAEIVNNVLADPRFIKGNSKICSMMCAPLSIKNKVIGVINISCNKPFEYLANDLKILVAIAFQASISVENARLYDTLNETYITVVHTLAETIEKRDPYTGDHTKRVMDYSVAIGEILGLSEDIIGNLKLGAVLHDIGKIGISDDVLLKKGKLTEAEYEKIKMHTVYGQEILENIKALDYIIPAVLEHHERFDGTGYPHKKKGSEIDIIARIVSVADSYDAMTTDRPYRKAFTHEVAIQEILENSGKQFDPQIVEAFITACKTGNIIENEVEKYA